MPTPNIFSKHHRPTRTAGERTDALHNVVFFTDAFRGSGNLARKSNDNVSVAGSGANSYFRFKDQGSHLRFAKGLYSYALYDASNVYVRQNKHIQDIHGDVKQKQDLSGVIYDILYTSSDAIIFLDTQNVTVNPDGTITFNLRSNLEPTNIASVDGVPFPSDPNANEIYTNYMPLEFTPTGDREFNVDVSYGINPTPKILEYNIGDIEDINNILDVDVNIANATARSLFPNSSDPSGVYKFGIVNDFMTDYFGVNAITNVPNYLKYASNRVLANNNDKDTVFQFPMPFYVNETFS